jgi:DNA-binding beta-propeller fold protein YncE
MIMKPIVQFMSLLLLLLMAAEVTAKLDAPDHIFYGNVSVYGEPANPGTVIEMRTAQDDRVLVRYELGRDPRLGGLYALRTPMDLLDPRQPGRARNGDPVRVYIGSLLAAEISVGQEGRTTRLDLDPQNLGTGPSISIDDIEVYEGDSGLTPATFTVTMNTTTDDDSVIDWHTEDGSAVGGASCESGIDYLSAADTLVIPTGELEGQIAVEVCTNTEVQDNRTFRVRLIPQTPAVLAKGVGEAVIIDDDDVPDLHVANASMARPEFGQSLMTFRPRLSRAHDATVSVSYRSLDLDAVAGLDYESVSGTLTLAPGEVEATVMVPILPGNGIGPSNQFMLEFYDPVNVNADDVSAIGLITDPRDDPALVHVDDVVTGEDGVTGLTEPTAMAISPDGEYAYVASESGNALLVFSRTSGNGRLTLVEHYHNDRDGFESASLAGPSDVQISPDGSHVYVAARQSEAISVFARDSTNGALNFIENQIQGGTSSGSTLPINGLEGIKALRVSPDGAHVYAVGAIDHALVVFGRNAETGVLSFQRAYVNNGEDDHGAQISHMNRPSGLAVSSDGRHVYVASRFGNAVQVFARDDDVSSENHGLLAFQVSYRNGLAGVSDLVGAYNLVLSKDGSDLYVVSEGSNAVVWFRRGQDGFLSQQQSWVHDQAGLPGLVGPQGISLAPDGSKLYVTGFEDHSLTVLTRQTDGEDSGKLSPRQTIFNGQGGITHMAGPVAAIASPDDRTVYVLAYESNAIVIFLRMPEGDAIFGDRFDF